MFVSYQNRINKLHSLIVSVFILHLEAFLSLNFIEEGCDKRDIENVSRELLVCTATAFGDFAYTHSIVLEENRFSKELCVLTMSLYESFSVTKGRSFNEKPKAEGETDKRRNM